MAVLKRLWLSDFRNYGSLELGLDAGRVVLSGRNGQGKSNVLEAVGMLGSMRSFRGAPTDALIRAGAERAVVRAEAVTGPPDAPRELLVEIELARGRPNRVQVNRQRVSRRGDLLGLVPTTVFGPDDLELVKGGPGVRRDFLDDLLVQLHPRNDRIRSDVDKVLRQRNALLRSAGGRLTPDVEATLMVWNAKFAEAGEAWGQARRELVDRLGPRVEAAYAALAGEGHPVVLRYDPPWRTAGLGAELEAARADELRRGVTLVGPHRDELEVWLSAMPARTHASQGEQRTLALSLRIAGHHELAELRGTAPLLLLDDVFSELDPGRAAALLSLLVADQTIVTTASATPPVEGVVRHLVVDAGSIADRSG